MKHLIIIGAGGMGRTFFDMAQESLGFGTDFIIKGFIDDNIQALDNFKGYPPMLGTISAYQPVADDCFVCSIGGHSRRKCMERIIERGGQFYTMIHRTARIGTNVTIGEGTVIGAYTSIGAEAKIGKYNLIQSYTVIGHDSVMGDWNRVDTHVTMVGGTQLMDEVDIYTGSVLNHGVIIESNSRVGALSFVVRRVKSGTTVMGSPAKVFSINKI